MKKRTLIVGLLSGAMIGGACGCQDIRNILAPQPSPSELFEAKVTEQPYDLAIDGADTFFAIDTPMGVRYTRWGAFTPGQNHTLILKVESSKVTFTSYQLTPIVYIPADASDVLVREDGVVLAWIPGRPDFENIGSVMVAKFADASELKPAENHLYEETKGSGKAQMLFPATAGAGKIRHGMLLVNP